MKRFFNSAVYVATMVFMLSLIGCDSSDDSSTSVSSDGEASEEVVPTVVYDSTIKIGSVTVGFSSLLVPTYYGYTWEGFHEDEYSSRNPEVKREGIELIFPLKNGKTKRFIDVPFDEEADLDPIANSVVYSFLGKIRNSDYYRINAGCYEYYYEIALNSFNGDTLQVIGEPTVSTQGSWMLAFNFDLEAAFTPNGFQLFEKERTGYKRIGTKLLDNWGINDVKWINDSVAHIQQVQFDDQWNQQSRYVKMTILKH